MRLFGCLNVWNDGGNSEWAEMAEIGDKVLMEFLLQDNPEFCAYSSAMIYTVWQNRQIDCQEKVCYLLGKVYEAFKISKNKGISLRSLSVQWLYGPYFGNIGILPKFSILSMYTGSSSWVDAKGVKTQYHWKLFNQ